ncbi:MAG: phosphoglucosamine mutase [Gammaproteobacteria bacterium]|nr:phosphoglucosamine mutase [Gammaproteobacteria bacterium]
MDQSHKYFGTDGIRGTVGDSPMTVDFVLKLGWAVGMMLSVATGKKVLIGKDTRISGYMIESALQAGLSSAGANIYLLGPVPTPGIAYLTQAFRAEIGIVISASHNPFNDNGIKFFSTDGFKLSKEVEQSIEYWLSQPIKTFQSSFLGKAKRVDDAQGRYIEFCKSSVPYNTQFRNLKIIIDCANGATYHIAPYVFSELGAEVIAIHSSPDGVNINVNCGSCHPEILRQRVLEEKADLGIAFDGDGDRVVMIDDQGEILDGDEILYIIARNLFLANRLNGGVISTEMSNKGFEIALEELNIPFLRVAVGDQNVIHALRNNKWLLGGEPSGHIMYLNATTTADGIISALQVLLAMFTHNKSLHEIKKGMRRFPQQSCALSHHGIQIDLQNGKVGALLKNAEKTLGKTGRVLLRYSGTEPVIRIMVEGEDTQLVAQVLQSLKEEIGALIKVV